MTINLRKITQGERGTLTFTWEFPENLTSPASISGAVITATMTDEDGVTTAVSGTLTGTAATTCTWALSAGDSGTAGTFTVLFRAIVTGVTTCTLEATLEVIANPAVTGTQNDPLVSISAADAAWVTLAATAVPDGGDVVDANDLGTAAYAATGDFDAAGAAAAAQAAAVQRANHTGTQLLSTISDAGTMAAQATTSYYAKTDFSAAPTAAEPLKADGSGGVQTKKLAVGAAQHSGSVVSAHYNAGGSLAFYIRESDGKAFWAAAGGFAMGGGTYPLSIAWSTNGSVTNSSGNLLLYNTAAGQIRMRTTNIDTLVLSADGGATFTPHTASEIGIILSLAAAATANALEVRSSVGAVLAKIEPDGEIQAAGYRSSDGTAGWTGTFLNGSGATVTVKNGLITGVA